MIVGFFGFVSAGGRLPSSGTSAGDLRAGVPGLAFMPLPSFGDREGSGPSTTTCVFVSGFRGAGCSPEAGEAGAAVVEPAGLGALGVLAAVPSAAGRDKVEDFTAPFASDSAGFRGVVAPAFAAPVDASVAGAAVLFAALLLLAGCVFGGNTSTPFFTGTVRSPGVSSAAGGVAPGVKPSACSALGG